MPGEHTDFGAPKIDKYAAGRLLATRTLHNIVQGRIWVNGRGVTEEYTSDPTANEVRVLKHKGLTSFARTIGPLGEENRSHFNTDDAEEPASDEFGIKLVHVFDPNIDVAAILEDMIALNVLNQVGVEIERRVTQMINGFTLATMFATSMNWADEQSDESRLIEFDPDNDDFLKKLMDAHSKLDEGDSDNGIDTFPLENRQSVFTTDAKAILMQEAKSVFEINSSRAVQYVEVGGYGELNELPINTHATGYFGTINQTPMHMISPTIIEVAEDYLDDNSMTSEGESDGPIYAVVNASEAIGMAMGFSRGVKIIDNPRGQGWRLQPLYRWGAEVFYPKGIAWIVHNEFSNPVTDYPNDKLEVIGKTSRE